MQLHCPVASRMQLAEQNVPMPEAKVLGQPEHLQLHQCNITMHRLATMRVKAVPVSTCKNLLQTCAVAFCDTITMRSDGLCVIGSNTTILLRC